VLGANPVRLAMACKYWSGFRRPRGATRGTRIGLADVGELGLGPRSARLALRALETGGLAFVERAPGRKPVVTLIEPRYGGRRLKRPIPWTWWHAACPLVDPAVRVALALWLRFDLNQGWIHPDATGAGGFEFDLDDTGSFGLSRYSARRGLWALRDAGLVSAVRVRGWVVRVRLLQIRVNPRQFGVVSPEVDQRHNDDTPSYVNASFSVIVGAGDGVRDGRVDLIGRPPEDPRRQVVLAYSFGKTVGRTKGVGGALIPTSVAHLSVHRWHR